MLKMYGQGMRESLGKTKVTTLQRWVFPGSMAPRDITSQQPWFLLRCEALPQESENAPVSQPSLAGHQDSTKRNWGTRRGGGSTDRRTCQTPACFLNETRCSPESSRLLRFWQGRRFELGRPAAVAMRLCIRRPASRYCRR